MVYINLRVNVADYDRWRLGFDANESNRRSAGSTGVNQFIGMWTIPITSR